MEIRKFFESKVARAALVLGLGATVLTGCANYSGDGNEFVVRGTVTEAGNESLKARITQVSEANGDAAGWFGVGNEHRLHDNCDCHGTWHGRKQYGIVLNLSGLEIEPSEVDPGACMEFSGKIRSDREGKTYNERPVYDIAQQVSCQT